LGKSAGTAVEPDSSRFNISKVSGGITPLMAPGRRCGNTSAKLQAELANTASAPDSKGKEERPRSSMDARSGS
jgi:hypothetical protein